jgi:hypothetical protein
VNAISGPLTDAKQAITFWERYVYPRIHPHLAAGVRLRISVREDTRTLEQNAKFHALCGDIAASRFAWMGKPRSAKDWKVLLVSGHAVATKEETDVLPGLEGEFINLRESTALMSIKRGSSLIEYTLAFMVSNDIPILEKETTCSPL